jgi:hypothetical protein
MPTGKHEYIHVCLPHGFFNFLHQGLSTVPVNAGHRGDLLLVAVVDEEGEEKVSVRMNE